MRFQKSNKTIKIKTSLIFFVFDEIVATATTDFFLKITFKKKKYFSLFLEKIFKIFKNQKKKIKK